MLLRKIVSAQYENKEQFINVVFKQKQIHFVAEASGAYNNHSG
jgi:hypothetical protein